MKTKKMNPLELDQQLCFKLYTASRLVTQAYEPLLKELNLTYPQYLVMLVLWEHNQLSVNEIGKKLRLDSGTLSPLIKKLMLKGFIVKERQEMDERVVAISLTSEGKDLQKKAYKVPTEMFCKFAIKEKEFLDIRSQLQILIDAIEDKE